GCFPAQARALGRVRKSEADGPERGRSTVWRCARGLVLFWSGNPARRAALVVMSVNSVTFVAPNLAWGEARGASARAPGASPGSGAVTDEQRSPRPNSAQPSGRRFFSAPAALLAPYRSA